MAQLTLFPTRHLRDRTLRRNYSARAEDFRREHERHRSWGLARRHARRLRQLHEARSEPPPDAMHDATTTGATPTIATATAGATPTIDATTTGATPTNDAATAGAAPTNDAATTDAAPAIDAATVGATPANDTAMPANDAAMAGAAPTIGALEQAELAAQDGCNRDKPSQDRPAQPDSALDSPALAMTAPPRTPWPHPGPPWPRRLRPEPRPITTVQPRAISLIAAPGRPTRPRGSPGPSRPAPSRPALRRGRGRGRGARRDPGQSRQ
jgi:hypothetical protein